MFSKFAVASCSVILASTALAADPPATSAVEPSASAAPVVAEKVAPAMPAAAGSARIRLFGRNGMRVDLFENSSCFGGGTKTVVSGGLGSAFSSFLGKVSNVSLGMRDTPNTLTMSQNDSRASKGYFKEYKVAAGQPMTLRMGYSIPNAISCGPLGVTLIPAEGKDYEAILDVNHGAGNCKIVLKEVQLSGTDVVLIDTNQAEAKSCP